MGLESVKCFDCQEYGHLAKDCKQKFYEQNYAAELGDGKPPWCSQCDRETRLVYAAGKDGLKARRCRNCHPKGESLPVQFRRCGACRTVVYEWDIRSECGQHAPVGQQLKCLIVVKGEVVKDEIATGNEKTGARK